jgi:hypothetical protein
MPLRIEEISLQKSFTRQREAGLGELQPLNFLAFETEQHFLTAASDMLRRHLFRKF